MQLSEEEEQDIVSNFYSKMTLRWNIEIPGEIHVFEDGWGVAYARITHTGQDQWRGFFVRWKARRTWQEARAWVDGLGLEGVGKGAGND